MTICAIFALSSIEVTEQKDQNSIEYTFTKRATDRQFDGRNQPSNTGEI